MNNSKYVMRGLLNQNSKNLKCKPWSMIERENIFEVKTNSYQHIYYKWIGKSQTINSTWSF